jgi:hypothetical protein
VFFRVRPHAELHVATQAFQRGGGQNAFR